MTLLFKYKHMIHVCAHMNTKAGIVLLASV